MTYKDKILNQLYYTPRMGHLPWTVPIEPHNSIKGLYHMVNKHFKPEFEIAEIGSFHGTSTQLFALFVDKVYSIDSYDFIEPEPGTHSEEFLSQHRKTFIDAERIFLERTSQIKNIIKIKKHGTEAAADFPDYSLDAVYIDAEHDYNSVNVDINTWKNKIKNGGILCGHDWCQPHIKTILEKENLLHNLELYSDDSWSVIINR